MKARKLITLVLALLMALSCFSALAEFKPTPIGEIGDATRDYVEPPEGDWLTPYDPVVNIRLAKGQGSDVVFENGEDQTNNEWIRAWYDKLGVQVSYDWIVDSGEYQRKLNNTIATGNLPDAFRVNYVQFRQLVKAGLIQDITEVYEKYTSQRVRDFEKTDPDTIKTAMVDGKLYGVPIYYYGVIDNPRYMWVRKDWYEEEGSPELKTVEDFENLCKTMMDKHGCYGIAVANNFEHLFMTGPMFKVYLGNPDQGAYYWYKDEEDGIIKPGIAHKEFKTALEYWAKWYQEGILSPDFVNMSFDDMNEDVVNGRAAFQPYYQWQGWQNGPNLVAAQGSNDAYMIPLQFPTVDGSQVLGQVGFPNGELVVVSKDCKNPAAVMKLISYTDYIMFDPNTKLTDEEFKAYTDGQREHVPGTVEVLDPLADMTQFEHVLAAIETGDTSDLFTAGMKKKYGDSMNWINNQDPGGLGAFCQQGFEGCSYDLAKYLLDNDYIIKTDMWGPPPEEFDDVLNTIDIISTGVSEIITGYKSVDDYDQILADWYAAGGQTMIDAVNKYYGEGA